MRITPGRYAKDGELMKNPEDMTAWFEARRQEFDALPDS